MGESPSLVGCFIWDQNHSFEMIRKSRECVINVPTVDLAETVVGIGNTSGAEIDKFAKFDLTAIPGKKVRAPLIEECHANFECKLVDSSLINRYSLFVFEVLKGYARTTPKFPETLHYRGDGLFMIAGPTVRRSRKGFKPEMLRA
jgi:flavin reductase (DIM6/NTAB) family NADH-FMN oxidoreductase RutF